MKLFRSYTMKWWQMALFKIYLLVAGLIIGAYFNETISRLYAPLLAVFIGLLVYFSYTFVCGAGFKTEQADDTATE